jgi:hypothetical protein
MPKLRAARQAPARQGHTASVRVAQTGAQPITVRVSWPTLIGPRSPS